MMLRCGRLGLRQMVTTPRHLKIVAALMALAVCDTGHAEWARAAGALTVLMASIRQAKFPDWRGSSAEHASVGAF
jgi:hypothetical protein